MSKNMTKANSDRVSHVELVRRLLPTDAAVPAVGTLERNERNLGTDAEATAMFAALRDSVVAVAELLVPDEQQRAQLLAGENSKMKTLSEPVVDDLRDSVFAVAELLVPDASQRAQLPAGNVRYSLHYFPESGRFDRRAARQRGDGAGAADPWSIPARTSSRR